MNAVIDELPPYGTGARFLLKRQTLALGLAATVHRPAKCRWSRQGA
jgi:hypothetical protein